MQDVELLKDIASTIAQIYFFNQDLQPAFCYFNKKEVTWIGLGGNLVTGYDKVIDFIGKYRDRDSNCELTKENYRVLTYGDAHAIVIGDYTFDMSDAVDSIFYIRISYCFLKTTDGWKIVHVHVSAPTYNDYLDRRMHQLQLATQTITAGLKGTLDDEKYTFTYVNNELCQMLGYTREEFMEMSGGTAVGAAYPPDVKKCCETVRNCFKIGDDYRIEYRIPKKDGTLMWVMDYGKRIRDINGNVRINSVVMDISDIKNTVSKLEIEKERNEIVAELSEDIIFDYDTQKDCLEIVYPASMNRGIREKKILLNYSKQEGWKQLNIREEDNIRLTNRIMNKELWNEYTGTLREEFRYNYQNEDAPWRRVLVRGILDSDGEVVRIIGKVFDITSEKKLVLSSTTDALTGAYNRTYLKQEFNRYLAEKSNDLSYACILIDIDYFKKVNDKYGHLQGDIILKKVVDALKSIVRDTDIVARLGGDEFLVFIKDIYDIALIEEKAKVLLDRARKCNITESVKDKLSLSIGITMSSRKDMNISTLYHQADVALYNAKEQGRGCYMIYTENMEHPTRDAD